MAASCRSLPTVLMLLRTRPSKPGLVRCWGLAPRVLVRDERVVLAVDRTRRRDTATIDVQAGAGRWVLRCDQDPDVTTELDDRYEPAELDRAAAYLTEAIAAAHHVAPDRIDLSIHPTARSPRQQSRRQLRGRQMARPQTVLGCG